MTLQRPRAFKLTIIFYDSSLAGSFYKCYATSLKKRKARNRCRIRDSKKILCENAIIKTRTYGCIEAKKTGSDYEFAVIRCMLNKFVKRLEQRRIPENAATGNEPCRIRQIFVEERYEKGSRQQEDQNGRAVNRTNQTHDVSLGWLHWVRERDSSFSLGRNAPPFAATESAALAARRPTR